MEAMLRARTKSFPSVFGPRSTCKMLWPSLLTPALHGLINLLSYAVHAFIDEQQTAIQLQLRAQQRIKCVQSAGGQKPTENFF